MFRKMSFKNNLLKILFVIFIIWIVWTIYSKIIHVKKEGYYTPLGKKELFTALGCDPKKEKC